MTPVWVVMWIDLSYNNELCGIFTSEKRAKDFITRDCREGDNKDNYIIEEWTLDG